MSTPPSGYKRKCPQQEPIHEVAKKKQRKAPEPRTRIVWKGCGCSAFITNECKYQHGFTHRGITKSCTDYESSRILHQPHVCGSDCSVPPAVAVCTYKQHKHKEDHEVPASSQPQEQEGNWIAKDISPVPNHNNASDWCYSQLDWYLDTP
ncbi:trans-activating protein [Sweet potato leaf curl Sao Paulo virus-[ZA:WP:2011]]|nr:trans-activating protein [Sweet potato leaf curl Sao Paulo virus-[ZA:WP:2011]]